MPKPSRRQLMKEKLTKRLESDYNKQKGVSKIFKTDLPGVKFWSAKDGDHLVDIIPYVVGKNDPNMKEGEDGYCLEVYVHNNVGQREGQIICLQNTFGKPCPICQEISKIQKSGGDEEYIKSLKASRYPRSIYNIICYDNAEEERKGIQVWHTSNFLLQQYILELAKRPIRPGQKNIEPYIAFMDPDDGRSIAFKKEGKAENTKFIGIRFEERSYKISDEILDAAHCLDELIEWPTYEQVYEDFWGIPYGSTTQIKETSATEDPEPSKQSRVNRHVESESEKEKNPEPAPSSRRSRNEPTDIPEPEAADEKTGSNRCPAGKHFGIDIDDLKECDKCAVWKDCAKESDRLEKEGK